MAILLRKKRLSFEREWEWGSGARKGLKGIKEKGGMTIKYHNLKRIFEKLNVTLPPQAAIS